MSFAPRKAAKLRSGELPSCECPIPCNYTTFTSTLSTAAIPNQNVAQLLINLYDGLSQFGSSDSTSNDPILLDDTYIRNNWILLDVFYEDINFQLYEQTEAISLSALISDIGGQMGLFLGASFITLAEILSYLGQKMGKCLEVKTPEKAAINHEPSQLADMTSKMIDSLDY